MKRRGAYLNPILVAFKDFYLTTFELILIVVDYASFTEETMKLSRESISRLALGKVFDNNVCVGILTSITFTSNFSLLGCGMVW
jgi:hypothetical protein